MVSSLIIILIYVIIIGFVILFSTSADFRDTLTSYQHTEIPQCDDAPFREDCECSSLVSGVKVHKQVFEIESDISILKKFSCSLSTPENNSTGPPNTLPAEIPF